MKKSMEYKKHWMRTSIKDWDTRVKSISRDVALSPINKAVRACDQYHGLVSAFVLHII